MLCMRNSLCQRRKRSDKKIASRGNSYNLNVKEQKIDGQKFTGNVEFEGMGTIWRYKIEEDCEMDMQYLLKLSSGKGKISFEIQIEAGNFLELGE